jgi:hypothetical protein
MVSDGAAVGLSPSCGKPWGRQGGGFGGAALALTRAVEEAEAAIATAEQLPFSGRLHSTRSTLHTITAVIEHVQMNVSA